MEYYKLLNFNREPFSNSPDPELFFRSARHAECMQKLEIAIRLRRGLCVVCGEVGTGKTTICRHLIRSMAGDDTLEIHMILDPSFESSLEMLGTLNAMFNGKDRADACSTSGRHKEMIKDYLFRTGVDQGKTIILVVDEGQKLSSAGVEILRELLNYETNDQKLLQIIIFAQNEINQVLEEHPNFADRVGLFHRLLPLTAGDTALFIKYRLERSGSGDRHKPNIVFSRGATRLVHIMTGGYPRKIINLCHNILLVLIIRGKFRVTPSIVREAGINLPSLKRPSRVGNLAWATAAAAAVLIVIWVFMPQVPGPGVLLGKFSGSESRETQNQVNASPGHVASYLAVKPGHNRQVSQPDEEQKQDMDPADIGEQTEAGPSPADGSNKPPRPVAEAPDPETIQAPLSLGHVMVNRNDTLWNIIERIYGVCDTRLIREVVRENPAISNMNIIHSGQRVYIPVIDWPRPALDREKYWIKTAGFETLDQAYQAVFEKPGLSLRVLSIWDQHQGLRHLVVLNRPFSDRTSAQKALGDLPDDLASTARIQALDDGVLVISRS